MSLEPKHAARISIPFLAAVLAAPSAFAHPGSGIVVDREGQVYFVDTGLGVWKVDLRGRMARHEGPAFHWMTIDRRGRFSQRDMPRGTGGELPVVGPDPTLILSSDFPVAIGSDGAFYYPQPEGADRVRMMRLAPSGRPEVFATLPPATEVGPDGKARSVPWIHGLAAGPDGSLYYAEMAAVRRIARDGTVSLVAGDIKVPDCVRPPAAREERLGPALRGLDVTPDGTVYVAASACSAVLKIAPEGSVSVVLRAVGRLDADGGRDLRRGPVRAGDSPLANDKTGRSRRPARSGTHSGSRRRPRSPRPGRSATRPVAASARTSPCRDPPAPARRTIGRSSPSPLSSYARLASPESNSSWAASALVAAFQLLSPALVLAQREDPAQVRLGEPLDLLGQARSPSPQVLTTGPQFLGQPAPAGRPTQRLRHPIRVLQQVGQVRPTPARRGRPRG